MSSYSVATREKFSLSRVWASLEANLRLIILIGFVEGIAVNLYASVLMPYFRTLGFGSDVAGSLSSILQAVMVLVGVFVQRKQPGNPHFADGSQLRQWRRQRIY